MRKSVVTSAVVASTAILFGTLGIGPAEAASGVTPDLPTKCHYKVQDESFPGGEVDASPRAGSKVLRIIHPDQVMTSPLSCGHYQVEHSNDGRGDSTTDYWAQINLSTGGYGWAIAERQLTIGITYDYLVYYQ